MNSIQLFNTEPFIDALKAFFEELKVPIDYLANEPASPTDVLGEQYKTTNEAHKLIDDIYALGMVNDAIFEGTETFKNLAQVKKLKADYDGLLLFGVTLKKRKDSLPITRSQLAEITRAFNRAFAYTPVTLVFKYNNYISFANSERIKYKQEWREGEKVGKVSLLKDISLINPHAAHQRILLDLGKHQSKTFNDIYQYWQKVLNTKELNKHFFKKIANWYFLSVAYSKFPYEYLKNNPKHHSKSDAELQEIANQKATIRFITRMIFVWFLKEKGLVPKKLFDKEYIDSILKKSTNESSYFNAILQNLFFATLNKAQEHREFALNKTRKENEKYYDVNSVYRYENLFRDENPEHIMKLFADIPFLNGGLFDSLDIKPDKHNNHSKEIIDGFSREEKWQAAMPDFLFFEEEEFDFDDELRTIYDTKKGHYEVKGLFAIFNEYKFTIEENTPLETDVALDPYLLGEIFENLLAYYNPETGTTARKGSGSFYTPQEIVNYMVEESLNTYIETKLNQKIINISNLSQASELTPNQKTLIVKALSEVKILDPACGSGAFPMGVLYKMVDVLKHIDADNTIWKKIQHDKIIGDKIAELEADKKAIEGLSDKQVKEKAKKAVEERLNDLENIFNNEYNFDDYARKLYIIQNCIYGVDIQDVAIQISKLRFFLSLIVDQKNNDIKPLPNLETKFVIANTLIGIDLPKITVMGEDDHSQDTTKALKEELKHVREQHFKAITRKEKQAIKAQDKAIREKIANSIADSLNSFKQEDLAKWAQEIETQKLYLTEVDKMPDMVQEIVVKDLFGGQTVTKTNYRKERIKEANAQIRLLENKIAAAQSNTQAELIRSQALKIAQWDIYNQNAQADWFDMDWMFGIQDGFDVVIGNPPYAGLRTGLISEDIIQYARANFKLADGQFDYYTLFLEKGSNLLNSHGVICYIIPKTIVSNQNFENARSFIRNEIFIKKYIDTKMPFENAVVESNIVLCSKKHEFNYFENYSYDNNLFHKKGNILFEDIEKLPFNIYPIHLDNCAYKLISKINKISTESLANFVHIIRGFEFGFNHSSITTKKTKYKVIKGENVNKFIVDFKGFYVNANFDDSKTFKKEEYFLKIPKLLTRFVSNTLIFSYDEEGYCNTNVVYNIHLKNDNINLKFLLAILNSKILNFWFFNIFMNDDAVFPHIQKNQLELIPIKNSNNQKPFTALVDEILGSKKSGKDTSLLEHQIDIMVYHLYELSYEEALVVDAQLSKADFEKYKII